MTTFTELAISMEHAKELSHAQKLGGEGGYTIKFYKERDCPQAQTSSILITKMAPLSYT